MLGKTDGTALQGFVILDDAAVDSQDAGSVGFAAAHANGGAAVREGRAGVRCLVAGDEAAIDRNMRTCGTGDCGHIAAVVIDDLGALVHLYRAAVKAAAGDIDRAADHTGRCRGVLHRRAAVQDKAAAGLDIEDVPDHILRQQLRPHGRAAVERDVLERQRRGSVLGLRLDDDHALREGACTHDLAALKVGHGPRRVLRNGHGAADQDDGVLALCEQRLRALEGLDGALLGRAVVRIIAVRAVEVDIVGAIVLTPLGVQAHIAAAAVDEVEHLRQLGILEPAGEQVAFLARRSRTVDDGAIAVFLRVEHVFAVIVCHNVHANLPSRIECHVLTNGLGEVKRCAVLRRPADERIAAALRRGGLNGLAPGHLHLFGCDRGDLLGDERHGDDHAGRRKRDGHILGDVAEDELGAHALQRAGGGGDLIEIKALAVIAVEVEVQPVHARLERHGRDLLTVDLGIAALALERNGEAGLRLRRLSGIGRLRSRFLRRLLGGLRRLGRRLRRLGLLRIVQQHAEDLCGLRAGGGLLRAERSVLKAAEQACAGSPDHALNGPVRKRGGIGEDVELAVLRALVPEEAHGAVQQGCHLLAGHGIVRSERHSARTVDDAVSRSPGNGAGVILPGGDIRERRFSIVVRFCLGIARQDRYEHGAGDRLFRSERRVRGADHEALLRDARNIIAGPMPGRHILIDLRRGSAGRQNAKQHDQNQKQGQGAFANTHRFCPFCCELQHGIRSGGRSPRAGIIKSSQPARQEALRPRRASVCRSAAAYCRGNPSSGRSRQPSASR